MTVTIAARGGTWWPCLGQWHFIDCAWKQPAWLREGFAHHEQFVSGQGWGGGFEPPTLAQESAALPVWHGPAFTSLGSVV